MDKCFSSHTLKIFSRDYHVFEICYSKYRNNLILLVTI